MNIFQRKNSKRAKETDGSLKKDSSRGKNDLFHRARGGLDALAGSLQSAKNDTEAATEKFQGNVKSGIETILNTGSDILEKAKAELGSHSEASRSKELEQGSEEQGSKNMEALNAVLDKVKSNPEVMEKVKGEVMNLAEAFHLTKHEPEEKANDGEAAKDDDVSASADKTEGLDAVEHAVEEIQAVVAGVQQQTARDETETEAAAAETSAEGEKPEATTREEKDDPSKRIGFLGFFAMLFERFCSPANKKKD
ncbi:hypothetical protein EJB05_16018 [Eragrostis curvula]|uniref:Uncharacterized protein n=1 Tax=Eragrostis curvula TaxID=38414 RepID=A0A5J9VFH3_9POAL|nr:hypothetical protein EJB05_16018 [Eragrostis curvula]